MIQGRDDSYYTVEELAVMVGRDAKTVRNWASQGRIQFVYLCGVPLISLRHVEQMITGRVPDGAERGQAAARMMNRSCPRQESSLRAAPSSRRRR